MARKIATIVGARPQFIKASVVSAEIAVRDDLVETLIHTGQHFDYGMSQVFFDELGIPEPKVNLGISGGTHAQMTARMMVALEDALLSEKPDMVLLYGDTNSTLAGALVAAKLHLPIVHVEAGARTWSMTNPEEINRICVDHIGSLLLACTEANLENLEQEGLSKRAAFVGDPMYDAYLKYMQIAHSPNLEFFGEQSAKRELPKHYYYLTCHREENTKDSGILERILRAMNALDYPVVYPVHPRNRRDVLRLTDSMRLSNVLCCEPVGYLESIYLVSHAVQVITDSGGLQREAFFAGVKCTTLLDFEVWPETMVGNRNLLAKPTTESIFGAMNREQELDSTYQPFGSGHASRAIVDAILALS